LIISQIRRVLQIDIDGHDDIAVSYVKSGCKRGFLAKIACKADAYDPAVVRGGLLDDFPTAVRASIFDEDDFIATFCRSKARDSALRKGTIARSSLKTGTTTESDGRGPRVVGLASQARRCASIRLFSRRTFQVHSS
jgi:hypothetical protein